MRKRSRRKVIRKIIKKRAIDGTFIPVEVTRTVIDRDGSKSITREDPEKYAYRLALRKNSVESLQSAEPAPRIVDLTNKAANGDPYSNSRASMPSRNLVEQHKSTTYQTTAHRSSSGAIVLNKITTITTTKPTENQEKED